MLVSDIEVTWREFLLARLDAGEDCHHLVALGATEPVGKRPGLHSSGQRIMKIPRPRPQSAEQLAVIGQPSRDHVHHCALALYRSIHRHQLRGEQFAPLALAQVAPDDDVDAAGLVL